jgi:hypothetical protein
VGNNYRSNAPSPTRIRDRNGEWVPFRSPSARAQTCGTWMAPCQPDHGIVADHVDVSLDSKPSARASRRARIGRGGLIRPRRAPLSESDGAHATLQW